MATKEVVSTTSAPKPLPQFSQAVKYNGMVYCSGNIGLNPETMKLVEGGPKNEMRQAIQNIKAILEEAGSSLANIVKMNIFITTMDDFGAINEAYDEFFKEIEPKPCRTCVAVYQLPFGSKVEIECTAFPINELNFEVLMASESPNELWRLRPPYRTPSDVTLGHEKFARKIQGSCHCGQIQYWLSREKPLASKYCHCKNCRVIHGAPFQWAAIFSKSDVAFENGAEGLNFYNSSSRSREHDLPCKVSCARCGSFIMDEGKNMVLLFPTLLNLDHESLRNNFEIQCHIFYPQRVVDIADGKPKWSGLDQKSELLTDN